MIKKILFVDDDRILRHLIQKKLDKYKNTFIVLTAEDGLDAVQKLKENTISLVVTDLQMPQMDGFALLAHLSEKYPDIPVIIQTGYSTSKSRKHALERGAAGYIEKPFKIEQLAKKIIATLKKESEGGILQTIPLEMFIQLIEMEQKTCTIRVVEKSSGELGVLFFRNGDLVEARIGAKRGKPAAYKIFSWGQVTLSIQDDCAIKNKRIVGDLQAILFDAMRLKDEAGESEEAFSEELDEGLDEDLDIILDKDIDEALDINLDKDLDEDLDIILDKDLDLDLDIILDEDLDLEDVKIDFHEPQPEAPSIEDIIRHKLESAIGERKCLKDIYQDNFWDDLILQASEIGEFLEAGALKFCYINKGKKNDFILVPGEQTTVVSVDPKCPRDKMLQALK
jgi:CheY-like chemotaxis protein